MRLRPRFPILASVVALLTALALGSAPATAASASDAAAGGAPGAATATCPTDVHAQKSQLRAMWISTVVNIDWPSAPGLGVAQQKAELASLLDLAVAQHHNAVILQVRPTADALFQSDVEPWSKYLTGKQGVDPGYDPLAFAVTEAHRRNLELHA